MSSRLPAAPSAGSAHTAPHSAPFSPTWLAATLRRFAAQPQLWRPVMRFTSPERWYQRLERTAEHEVWLLTWLPGQETEIHDHGGSQGAFGVVDGALTERTFPGTDRPAQPRVRQLRTGTVRAFGPRHIHQVTQHGSRPAVSIHAYAPSLTTMSSYLLGEDERLRLQGTDSVDE